MKRIILFLLGALLLTAQAEEIDSPLVHSDEMASEFLTVDISPVITFQTDETGVFAVVVLASSDELPTPAPEPSPAPSEVMESMEAEETVEEPAAFIISTRSTSRSLVYTLTPITMPPEEGENP